MSMVASAEPDALPVSAGAFEVVDLDVDAADVPFPPNGLDTAERPVDQRAIKRFSCLRGINTARAVAGYVPRASSIFSAGADIAG